MIIVNTPASVLSFCDSFVNLLRRSQRDFLAVVITAIILARRPRTQAEMGRVVLSHLRHRSSICRRFQRHSFCTRDAYSQVTEAFISRVAPVDTRSPTWVLIIDGVGSKRGGFTKIENARKYKPKGKRSYGRSSKAHTFVMGLLITDKAQRIPVPRKSYYTKRYCEKHKRHYFTQQQLAAQMITEQTRMLPQDIDLIVLADEYFEGSSIDRVCREFGHSYIAPVCSSRCFADPERPGKSNGHNIYDHGKSLPPSTFKQICLVEGEEVTAVYRRYSLKRPGKRRRRYFRIAHEITTVSKLGEVVVVYSWKRPVYNPRCSWDDETFKVLICNNKSLTPEEIVDWYDIRWQIELLFRELKGLLGLTDYRGGNFAAFERHVDLVLLSFLFLEYQRWKLLQGPNPAAVQGFLKHARTQGMQQWLANESLKETLCYLAELSKNTGQTASFLAKLQRLLREIAQEI